MTTRRRPLLGAGGLLLAGPVAAPHLLHARERKALHAEAAALPGAGRDMASPRS